MNAVLLVLICSVVEELFVVDAQKFGDPVPPLFIHDPNPETVYFKNEVYKAGVLLQGEQPTWKQFRCKASGYPPPTYTWLKDGEVYNLDDPRLVNRISRVSDEGSFYFTLFQSSDSGTYQCHAYNGHGVAVDHKIHFVEASIADFPNKEKAIVNLTVGDSYTKVCNHGNSVPHALLGWFKTSDPADTGLLKIEAINCSRITQTHDGMLFFQFVEAKDENVDFACMATNPYDGQFRVGDIFHFALQPNTDINRSATAVKIYYSPKEITALQNEDLHLYCVVGGGRKRQLPKWSKEGGEIDYDRVNFQWNFNRSLTLKNVSVEDQGKYKCHFEDTSLDETFNVKVESAPFWNSGQTPKSINSKEGRDVEFHCDVGGVPSVYFTFFKNGEQIAANDKYEIENGHLKVRNVAKPADTGVFQCKAQNSHGYLWANFYLNVL